MRWSVPNLVSMWAVVGGSLVATSTSCTRPVDLPTGGATFVTDVVVSPEFVRADVPVEVSFLSSGRAPSSVTVEIAGEVRDCTPEVLANGRLRCVRESLERTTPQGVSLVVVKATGEDGEVSTAAGQLHVDFECPAFLRASVSRPIAEAKESVVVTIDASEVLGNPPIVTRRGRDWGTPVGSGSSWSLTREVTSADPAQFADIVIRLEDRAGNSTGDCGTDALVPFAVDLEGPVVDASSILLERGAPGAGSVIAAPAGSVVDDVGIARLELLDPATGARVAAVEVGQDGSIEAQSVESFSGGRVVAQAVDLFGRRSDALAVRERWQVTVGSASTPGAAVRTATRFSPAVPTTRSMHDQTVALAPDILQEDARSAVIRSSVGFRQVGQLPTRFENSKLSSAGYDPVSKALVIAGGYNGPDPASFIFFAGYMNLVQTVRWDQREGRYIAEQGPLLSYEESTVPEPRYGNRLAFDETSGCGVMFGGDALVESDATRRMNDLWRICGTPGGYEWQRIELEPTVDGNCVENFAPMVWDRFNQRYVLAGDGRRDCGDTRVVFLERGASLSDWRWINLQPLPTNFGERFGSLLYVDHVNQGFSLGLGGVSPGGQGLHRLAWTYLDGQWTTAEIPSGLFFRARFGYDYDVARSRLTVWGGNDDSRFDAEPEVWYLTDTSTNGPSAWRSTRLDNPTVRHYPNMVYDSDREVMLIFGGVDWDYDESAPQFERFKPGRLISSDIWELSSQPSFPYMQVVADLATTAPKGIEHLRLSVRAQATGDLDGEGAGVARGGGFRVLIWDHIAREWDTVHAEARDALAGFEQVDLTIEDPARYISPDGTVPITVAPISPATEAVDGRLEVDVVVGELELRTGVNLP